MSKAIDNSLHSARAYLHIEDMSRIIEYGITPKTHSKNCHDSLLAGKPVCYLKKDNDDPFS